MKFNVGDKVIKTLERKNFTKDLELTIQGYNHKTNEYEAIDANGKGWLVLENEIFVKS